MRSAARGEVPVNSHGSALRWAAALGNADWCVTGPLVAALATAWRTDVTDVTSGVAAHALGYGCALPLWGIAADRLGARRTLRLGLLLAAAASTASAACPGPGWWTAVRMAAGAAFAAVTPCVSLFCESAATARERHSAFAGLTAVTAAAAVTTPVLAALAVAAGSWRAAYALIAVATVATACRLGATAVAGPPAAGPHRRPRVRAGGRAPRTTVAYRIVIGIGLVEGAALLTLPALLAPSLTLSGARTAASWAPALYAAGVWTGAALLRRHRRARGPARLLALGGTTAVSAAGLAAAVPGTVALLAGALLLGAAWGLLHTTLQTWLPRLLPPGARARAASLFAASAVLACSVTIPVGVSLLSSGLRSAVFAGCGLACAALTCLVVRTARRWRGASAPSSCRTSDTHLWRNPCPSVPPRSPNRKSSSGTRISVPATSSRSTSAAGCSRTRACSSSTSICWRSCPGHRTGACGWRSSRRGYGSARRGSPTPSPVSRRTGGCVARCASRTVAVSWPC